MRRILWLLTATVVLLIVLCASLKFIESRRPDRGITLEAFELIQEGMTEAEVERILGCPAGDYAPGYEEHGTTFILLYDGPGAERKEWHRKGIRIPITFCDGEVYLKDCRKPIESRAGPPTVLDRILYRLGCYSF